MTLPTSNISFSAIQSEFGGSNPISLSEYYRGGSYVRTNTTMPYGTIASSGSISLSTFLGATQGVLASYSLTRSTTSVNEGGSFTVTFATNQAGSFAYTITGVDSADIGGASLTGTVSNGSVLSYNVTADSKTEGTEVFTISLNNGLATTSVTINDTSLYPGYGTYLGQSCIGYNLYYIYADGNGGSFSSLFQSNSPTCGYTPPTPTATWSVGYSNNGTAGPISSFVAVNLSSAALSTVTFTFSGVVVQNGVSYPIPNVTIAAGQTSGTANTYVGIVNGSGPYSTITLRATVTSQPYTITNGTTIDTSFLYSA
jgi:hypothetical protein